MNAFMEGKAPIYTAGGTLSNPLRADNSTGMFFAGYMQLHGERQGENP